MSWFELTPDQMITALKAQHLNHCVTLLFYELFWAIHFLRTYHNKLIKLSYLDMLSHIKAYPISHHIREWCYSDVIFRNGLYTLQWCFLTDILFSISFWLKSTTETFTTLLRNQKYKNTGHIKIHKFKLNNNTDCVPFSHSLKFASTVFFTIHLWQTQKLNVKWRKFF